MKIAITASEGSLEGPVDPRFGRAAWFIVADVESGEHEVIDNTANMNAAGGAGVQASSKVGNLGVEAIVTGHCGPKAFRGLTAAGIRIFQAPENVTVAEALEMFRQGRLREVQGADVQGHWM